MAAWRFPRRRDFTPGLESAGVPARWLPILPAVLCALPAAANAASWQPPRELTGARSAPVSTAATAAVDARGTKLVLWHSERGVEAAAAAARRGFGEPAPIPGSRQSMGDLTPQLAFDARGAAVALWSYFEPHPQFVDGGYKVEFEFGLRAALRPPGKSFERAETLTDDLETNPNSDLAIDAAGTAVAVWSDDRGLHAMARPRGAKRFQRAEVLSVTEADPQVGTSSRTAVATWSGRRGGNTLVRVAVARHGETFGDPGTLKLRGLGGARPAIAVDSRARITAAWARRGRVHAATCNPDGSCGETRLLSAPGEDARDPRVAVGADGTAVIAWRNDEGVATALRPPRRHFRKGTTVGELADGERLGELALTVGARGDAAAVWTVRGRDRQSVKAALRAAGRRFGRARTISADVEKAAWNAPEVAVGPKGDVLAVWGGTIDGRPVVLGASR